MAEKAQSGRIGHLDRMLRWLSVPALLLAAVAGYWTYETDRRLEALRQDAEARGRQPRINPDMIELVAKAASGRDPGLCLTAAEIVLQVRHKTDVERGLCQALLQARHCSPDTEERLRARCDLPEAGGRQTTDYAEAVRRALASPVPTGRFDRSPGRAPSTSFVTPPSQRYDLGDWEFDLFYCEATVASDRSLAEAMAEALIRQHGALGGVRVRGLPDHRHRRATDEAIAGYLIRGTAEELPMVMVLRDIARQTVGREFNYRQTSEETRWYVSLFFCGGPTD